MSASLMAHYPVIKVSPSFTRDSVSPTAAVVGDVNGDGLNDLLVCYAVASACSIFFGKRETGLTDVTVGVGLLGSASSFFGYAAGGAGDLNGDGYADMIVSALTGRVCYVLYGRASWTRELRVGEFETGVDGYRVVADSSTTLTGLSVGGVGDMNGDGKVDVAMSVQRGGMFIVYVIWGKGMGVGDVMLSEVGNGVQGIRIIGEQGYYTGLSISGGGDVNDDGEADLIIGAVPLAMGSASQRSYVIFGSNSSSSAMEDVQLGVEALESKGEGVVIEGGGFLVSSVGDVNDDGIDDVMVTVVDDYIGRGNTYIVPYPKKITSPPSLLPSSAPSSSPSLQPTSSPSTSMPSNPPSRSISPSFEFEMNVTMKPTMTPSRRPSRLPSKRPSLKPSVPPTKSPSQTPSVAPSKWRSPSMVPSKSPSFLPTWQPTRFEGPTRAPSMTLLLLPWSEYVVRLVNMTSSSKTGGVVYGVEGLNEIFEISSLSVDGKRMSGWSGRIIISVVGSGSVSGGGTKRGRKVYVIYPKDVSEVVNRIVLEDFDRSSDIIDLSHYSQIESISDLVYFSGPLSLFLVDGQSIEFPTHMEFDLSEENFVFGGSSLTSSSSEGEGSSSIMGGIWSSLKDISILTPMIVVLVFLMSPFFLSFLYKRKEVDNNFRGKMVLTKEMESIGDQNIADGIGTSPSKARRVTFEEVFGSESGRNGSSVNGSESMSSQASSSSSSVPLGKKDEIEQDNESDNKYSSSNSSYGDFDSFSSVLI